MRCDASPSLISFVPMIISAVVCSDCLKFCQLNEESHKPHLSLKNHQLNGHQLTMQLITRCFYELNINKVFDVYGRAETDLSPTGGGKLKKIYARK